MKRFIQGEHRGRRARLPESLDEYVTDTMFFVDELDLGAQGFDGVIR